MRQESAQVKSKHEDRTWHHSICEIIYQMKKLKQVLKAFTEQEAGLVKVAPNGRLRYLGSLAKIPIPNPAFSSSFFWRRGCFNQ